MSDEPELSAIQDAIANGSEPERDAPEPEEVDDGGDDAAEELIGGKFKTQDDLLKSYQEAERKIHELSNPQPEPEAEEEAGPFDWLPPHVSEETLQQLAYAFNQDPIQAAVDVFNNPQILGQHGTNQLLREFAKDDPFAWSQAWSRINQPQSNPVLDRAEQFLNERNVESVKDWATQSLPEFGKYGERIATVIRENEAYYDQFLTDDPASMQSIVRGIYDHLVVEDWRASHAAQTQEEQQPAQVPAAKRTATKSTAGRPTSDSASTIQEMIANARA